MMMYADDHDGYFLEGWYPGCPVDGIWPYVVWPWREENPKLSYCPMAKRTVSRGGRTPFAAWGTADSRFYGSYGINSWALNPPAEILVTEGHLTSNNWRRSDVRGAGTIPLLLDSQWVDGWPEDVDEPLDAEDQSWDDCVDATVNNMWRFSVNRHDGNLNTLFIDGSVRKTGIKQLWKLKWHRTYNTGGTWTLSGGVQRNDWPEWMANFKDY
jgi:prepilin-type processing-associated H-X9-DG protein